MSFQMIQRTVSFTLITMLFIGISSCESGGEKESSGGSGKKEQPGLDKEVKSLFDEVMKVHDEVMPKDKNIQSLKNELKALKDTLAPKAESDTAKRIDKAVSKLKRGHKVMMDWMHQFEKPDVEEKKEKAMKYLGEQKVKIEAVRDSMLTSIENAREVLMELDSKKK